MTQELMLANHLFDSWDGKRITIRRGIRRIVPGEQLVFVSTEPVDTITAGDWIKNWDWTGGSVQERGGNLYLTMPVYVMSVTYVILHDIDEADLVADGFRDAEEMFNQMKQFYPDLSWADKMTIVKFQLQDDYFGMAENDVT